MKYTLTNIHPTQANKQGNEEIKGIIWLKNPLKIISL